MVIRPQFLRSGHEYKRQRCTEKATFQRAGIAAVTHLYGAAFDRTPECGHQFHKGRDDTRGRRLLRLT
jgi:hypothetical protein